MSSKFSLVSVVTTHYGSMNDARTGRPRFDDYAALFGGPVATFATSYFLGWRLQIVSEMIAAISITTGLLFALVVFVFQLRLQLATAEMRERVPAPVTKLITELFANVAYSIVAGFVTTAVLLIGAALRATPEAGAEPDPLGAFTTGLVLAATVHFGLCLAMCLKRLMGAFDRLGNL